jgi:hypothetical protein
VQPFLVTQSHFGGQVHWRQLPKQHFFSVTGLQAARTSSGP